MYNALSSGLILILNKRYLLMEKQVMNSQIKLPDNFAGNGSSVEIKNGENDYVR